MFDPIQFRQRIVKPVLQGIGMWNENAEELMMGTCAVESAGGTYLVQLGGGTALGIFQMEVATHDDIWVKWLPNNAAIASNLMRACILNGKPTAQDMIQNLYYSCAMARIQYFRNTPDQVPDTLEGQAMWWLRYYNRGGTQTVEKYVEAYKKFVGGQNATGSTQSKPQSKGKAA